jgi:hypothetical protein
MSGGNAIAQQKWHIATPVYIPDYSLAGHI